VGGRCSSRAVGGNRLVRLSKTFWAGAVPEVASAEDGAEATEGGVELVAPRPGLVDAHVQVPAPAGDAGRDGEDLVAQGGWLRAKAPSRHSFAVHASRSWPPW
jgi:hypothetical protein